MPNENLNIANIAKGALLERADIEIRNVLSNIYDKNTDWKKKRKVTLTLEFTAMDEQRDTVKVDLIAKSTVQPYNPVTTQLFIGKDNSGNVIGQEYARGTVPGQQPIVDEKTGEILEEGKHGKKIVNINR